MALILSRKRSESIVIDGNIIITVDEINGGSVALAITAPRHVRVDRLEIHEAREQRHSERVAG